MTTNNGPYKRDGETVYATEPIQESDDGGSDDSDSPKYRDKEWLYYQYHILGKSLSEIADLADVSTRTINNWRKKHDIPGKDISKAISKAQGGNEKLWNEDWLRDQYLSKEKSSGEIAKLTGMSKRAVLSALDRYGIPVRSRSEYVSLIEEKKYGQRKYNDKKWLEWQYIQRGKSAMEIAEENGWSETPVRKALKRHGIPMRSNKEAQLLRYADKKGGRQQPSRQLVNSEGIDASWADLTDVENSDYVQYRDKEWMQSQARRGLTLAEIASKCSCDVSSSTIRRWLRKFGCLSEAPDGMGRTREGKDDRYKDEEWLRNRYCEDGKSLSEIADICKVSVSTISYWADRYDIELRGRHGPDWDDRHKDEEWLRNRYCEDEKTISEIADICEVSAQTISYWMDRYDIQIRGCHGSDWDDRYQDEEWLRRRYVDEGMLQREIAEECGVAPNTVTRWVNKFDLNADSDTDD